MALWIKSGQICGLLVAYKVLKQLVVLPQCLGRVSVKSKWCVKKKKKKACGGMIFKKAV